MINGIKKITPPFVLNLITSSKAPQLAFAASKITADALIKQISFGYSSSQHPEFISNVKQMIRDFTSKERQMFVKFVTGSSRLGPSRRINIAYRSDPNYNSFPVAHTCSEEVEICEYNNDLEQMKN